MLTRIEAENFLSLKKVGVDLGQLNVFIGKNASGKSNFVRLLRFTGSLAISNSILNAARGIGFRGPLDLAYGGSPGEDITIIIRVRLDQEYLYGIRFRASDGSILAEELRAGGEGLFKRSGGSVEYLREDGFSSKESIRMDNIFLYRARGLSAIDARVRKFADYLAGWAFYNFNPARIRGTSPIGASEELAYDGGNLPQVLHTLLTTRRREFNRVEELLQAVIPEVEELLTPVVEGNYVRIAIRERGFDKPFEPEHLSDGTLRLLAFITALALPSSLVSFEEPENCVHPELLGALVELMRRSGRQVVVTTHSPSLLDHANPEEVYLVAKVRGETRIRRLATVEDIESVKRYLELGGSLGEAWLSGLLGNGY